MLSSIFFSKKFFLVIINTLLLLSLCSVYASAEDLSIEDIVRNNASAVVLVGAVSAKGSSFGSGFIVSSDGLIVTNFHVVRNAIKIGIKLKSNKTYNDVLIINSDPKKDIAILKISGTRFASVVLGDSNSVQAGEKVVAIGNPLGLENTVADGLISSIREIKKGTKVLQITVPVSPGSSGCPLFNMQGEVIGIAVGTNVDGQNINFAIPINDAKKILRLDRQHQARQNQKDSTAHKRTPTDIYIVKRGDTLFDLARQFDTTVEALTRLNNLSDTKIFAGQRLNIPSSR
jgi:S1-C subfamily serine protease